MVKVILVGLGSLGEKIAAFLMERKDVRLVAVVDPRKAGKDVGQEATEKKNGLLIYGELETAVKKHRPEVAILATVSRIETLEPLVAQLASLKLSIVSTCEELSYPWKAHPLCARRIDRMCRAKKVACLATGVNPGYLMDYLPLVLTSICQQVTRIEVQRVQNARKRRLSFQKKIGTGLTVAEFRRLLQQGQIRHVGLRESMDMLAAFSGWQKVKTVERIRPVIARKKIKTLLGVVTPGRVSGVEQIGQAFAGQKEVIRLVFRACASEENSYDSVNVSGSPSFEVRIDEGIHGDVATAAIVINAVHAILKMPPGLWTMPEIPVACFRRN